MQNRKEIGQNRDFLDTLKSLAMAYEDISIIKMQQTRNTILQARIYISRLKEILESIQKEDLLSNLDIHKASKKKELATVIITANTKFHGDIVRQVFDSFSHSNREVGDVYLLGNLGKEFLYEYDKSIKYISVPVSDLDISMKELKPFLTELLNYKKIDVYYAIFKNLVLQEAHYSDIANIDLLSEEEIEEIKKNHERSHFLFEPTVKDIHAFVNDNAVGLLLLQTVYETQLARFASRMKAMDALIQKIDDDTLKLNQLEHRITRRIENTKQQERLTGITLW